MPRTPSKPQAGGLSSRALSTPEPFVRLFARRVQQEGALDLTQGDYKNADFAPHPEVVRAAQRITRNTVHSYGPGGRPHGRAQRGRRVLQPRRAARLPGLRGPLPARTRCCSRRARAPASPSCSRCSAPTAPGVVVPRPSWEYDWFIERAGKKVVELPTTAPEFLPDPQELDRLLARGGISSVIINNPHNPTGRVYPRALVEELVRVAVKHRCYVLYDSVYQRLDYVGWFVNPAFANPEWRDWVVSLSGLSKMDMFGASTGARACWLVISDQIRANGVRAREILANLSAWLVATPSTLAQDWALAALQSPLAALRRPSPYMRERRDYMVRRPTNSRPLGVERTDFGGTFYSPARVPRPGRRTVRPAAQRRAREGRGQGLGGRLRVAAVGRRRRHPVRRVRRRQGRARPLRHLAAPLLRLEGRQGTRGLHGPRPRAHREAGPLGRGAAGLAAAAARRQPQDAVWDSACTADGYDALDGLDAHGVRGGAAAVPREPAPRGAAPDRHQAPRLDHAPRRAGRARAARRRPRTRPIARASR